VIVPGLRHGGTAARFFGGRLTEKTIGSWRFLSLPWRIPSVGEVTELWGIFQPRITERYLGLHAFLQCFKHHSMCHGSKNTDGTGRYGKLMYESILIALMISDSLVFCYGLGSWGASFYIKKTVTFIHWEQLQCLCLGLGHTGILLFLNYIRSYIQ
jgi:hypothetical protein